MSTYLQAYLDQIIARGNEDMALSIQKTALDFSKNYLDSFSFL